jgi:hypothetical protein
MARPWDDRQKDLLCPALDQIIDLGHPLVRLADAIDWRSLDGRDSGDPIGDAQDRRHRDEGSPDHGCVRPERRPSDAVRYSGCPADSVAALTSTMRAGAMDRIIARLGDACAAPFAVLGLPPVRQREIARFPGYFGFTFTRSTRWSLISPEPRLRLYSRSGAQEGRFRIAPSAEVTSLRHQVGGDLTNLLRGQVLRILVHDLVSPRR